MMIVFFARLFYPHIGGVEKHVFEISKILIKKGYKIIVFTEQFDTRLKLTDSIQGVEIYRIPVGKDNWSFGKLRINIKKFKIWLQLWKYRSLIEKADIVHCHDIFFWYLPFRFLYPKKPVYTTFHGYEGNSLPSKKAIFMHKLAEKISLGNICVGDYLKKWYGTKPDFVTYGGVEVLSIKYKVLSINKEKKIKIVFVGRLEEETGIMEYLKALKILKEKGYELHLNILGDGSQREKAEKFCDSNKLAVDFRGFVNNVSDYLAESKFVFTSRYLGILGAMDYRKLIFAVYNNGVKKDYLLTSPFSEFIVIANSKEQIFSKLVDFLKNPNKEEKIVDKAYNWVKDQTWDKVSETYIKLWYKEHRKNGKDSKDI